MKTILLPIFNRATFSRCKSVISEINEHPTKFKLEVVLSSSLLWGDYEFNTEILHKTFTNVGFHALDCGRHDANDHGILDHSARIVSGLSNFIKSLSVGGMIVVADRYETLPAAMVAAYLRIPLFHLQGGEVTGNIDERVRHSVTKLSDYHFACTKLAKEYLLQMGEPLDRVFHTGCPSLDLIKQHRITRKRVPKRYIISIFHPDTETQEEAFEQTKTVLEATLDYCGKHETSCIWFWPNNDPGREKVIEAVTVAHSQHPAYLQKAVNYSPESFLRLLSEAVMIIGNSSCGLREASYIGVPTVNIGDRQRLRERGWNVYDVGHSKEEILEAMEYQHAVHTYPMNRLYGNAISGKEIVRRLLEADFTLKDSLTYPDWVQFRAQHTGHQRFVMQNRRKNESSIAAIIEKKYSTSQ